MKKILNWTIGSMFRTIGRFIGLLLISCLFGFMLIKSGIKITDFFNIETIKADTTYSWTAKQSRIYYDNSGTESVYNWHDIPYTHSADYPITKMQYRLQYSGGLDSGNTYTFTISYTPNPDAINVSGLSFSDSTGAITGVNCSGWSRNSSGKYSNTCAINPTRNISSSAYLYVMITYNEAYLTTLKSEVGNFSITKGVGAVIQDSAIDIMNNSNNNTNTITNSIESMAEDIADSVSQSTLDMINNQNANSQAQIDANKTCKVQTIKYTQDKATTEGKYIGSTGLLQTQTGFSTMEYIEIEQNKDYTLSFSYSNVGNSVAYCLYDKDKVKISCTLLQQTQTFNSGNAEYITTSLRIDSGRYFTIKGYLCTSKLDDTTNSINNLNDSLNDSDTSSASSDALDFFNNFNDNSHGLTSIITTPLNTIRLMLSDTCVAPHTIYKGKTISLPCGSILWSRPGANSLKDFLNLVYGGLISYYLIVNLLSLVNDFKNPDNDKIEVADL